MISLCSPYESVRFHWRRNQTLLERQESSRLVVRISRIFYVKDYGDDFFVNDCDVFVKDYGDDNADDIDHCMGGSKAVQSESQR